MNRDDVWQAIDDERLSQVEGPVAAILLLLTGRPAALSQLSGPGVAELQTRLSPQPSLI